MNNPRYEELEELENDLSYFDNIEEIKEERNNVNSSILADIQQLKQSIHNLKMTFPIGILSVDNPNDEKLDKLNDLLQYKLSKLRL